MIEGHGDDIYKYGDKIKHNFSSNICQNINHTDLFDHLVSHMRLISNYPEPSPVSVEKRLSDRHHIDPCCVMATNGAVEAIYIIAQAFQGSRSRILEPTFSEYADACILNNHQITHIADIDESLGDSGLVWICNPNNPTGKVIPEQDLDALIMDHPDKIFVIDQAYHGYTEKEVFTAEECVAKGNLILLYSLTKDFAIPGLRLGYIVANHDIINRLRRFRGPWSVNALAIEAANYYLDNPKERFDRSAILKESRRIASRFSEMGIATIASDTNYLLCEVPKGSSSDLKDFLVEKYGILIRDASNFHGLTARHFRVAAQGAEENDLLIEGVKRWLEL